MIDDHNLGTVNSSQPTDRVVRFAAVALVAAIVLLGLTAGATLLVPVAEAVIVWFLINGLARTIRRLPIPLLRARPAVALVISVLSVFALCSVAVYTGVQSTLSFGPNASTLQNGLDPLVNTVADTLGKDRAVLMDRALEAVSIETLLQQIVVGLLSLLNQFGVVAIYVAFLLADQVFFEQKMKALFPNDKRRLAAENLLAGIGKQVGAYLSIMTQVSGLTAVLSYVVLLVLGVQNAGFWAFLIFVLNFIPTIGSILGTLLPSIFALAQFQELQPAIILLLSLGLIQATIGNVIFPRIAGNVLNLSFFVTIFSLFFWGALWGITGMFLAVPMTAILVLVLAQFEHTRPIAIVLSKDGLEETG